MDYAEAITWLYGTQQFGIKLGLENIRRLLEVAKVDPGGEKVRYIHVAGTNGKGSVCAMLDAICRQTGMRTGLFTSPHLIEFGERIRVNGQPISREEIAVGLTQLRHGTEDWGESPTFFEYTTALGLRHFQEREVEIAIIETGMGGRLDSTNVIRPVVSVLTPIGLDHQRWLGHEIEDIANEKAGIIKSGRPAVSAPQSPRAAAVLENAAKVRGSALSFVPESYQGELGLTGEHQRANAALALAALLAGRVSVTEVAIREGLSSVQWKGRFQKVQPDLVLDGAHNGAAVKSLVRTWRAEFSGQKATVIFGVLQDKDIVSILRELVQIAATLLLVPVPSPRGAEPARVRELAAALFPQLPVVTLPSLADALENAREGTLPVLVAGSLFLVGEALALLETHHEPVVQSEQ